MEREGLTESKSQAASEAPTVDLMVQSDATRDNSDSSAWESEPSVAGSKPGSVQEDQEILFPEEKKTGEITGMELVVEDAEPEETIQEPVENEQMQDGEEEPISEAQSEIKGKKPIVMIDAPQQHTEGGKKESDVEDLILRPSLMQERKSTASRVTTKSLSMARETLLSQRGVVIDLALKRIDPDNLEQMFTLGIGGDQEIFSAYDEKVEQEESTFEEMEEAEMLDRAPYYEKYNCVTDQLAQNRAMNFVYQKKVSQYLKRRKAESFLKETEVTSEQISRYHRLLEAYGDTFEANNSRRQAMVNEMDFLNSSKDEKFSVLAKLFNGMQSREASIGYGLINTKTGKVIPDKVVERLLKRQSDQVEEISRMRLNFIKLRTMVQEKTDALAAVDLIGENLHLTGFEQLKVENRSYADKIEERDEELTKLRHKSKKTVQLLAHMREKSSALETDLLDFRDDLLYTKCLATKSREELNELKLNRDKYRNMTYNIKQQSGLLMQPELLRDMELSMEEVKRLQAELDTCKSDFDIKSVQITKLRRMIEHLSKLVRKREIYLSLVSSKKKSLSSTFSRSRHSHFRKPSDSKFENVIEVKSKPEMPRTSKR